MVCRCSPRSSLLRQTRFGRYVDRGCAPAGLAWMEEPRRLSLPDHGQRRDRQTGAEPAGEREGVDAESALNDVSTHL